MNSARASASAMYLHNPANGLFSGKVEFKQSRSCDTEVVVA
jgi:hypothetical protein